MSLLRERVARRGIGAIEPCLPSHAKEPPSGPGWIHEIKHDGLRIMAHRDDARVQLITRAGNHFAWRFPRIAEAVTQLSVQSCVIDGEAMVCDENGLADFELIRRQRTGADALLYTFDMIELDEGSAPAADRGAEGGASEAATRRSFGTDAQRALRR